MICQCLGLNITNHKIKDHISTQDLLLKTNLPSVNQLAAIIKLTEAWKCMNNANYHIQLDESYLLCRFYWLVLNQTLSIHTYIHSSIKKLNNHRIVKVLESRGEVCHHPSRDQLRVLSVGRDGVKQVTSFHIFGYLKVT